jgi:hypothetical protein
MSSAGAVLREKRSELLADLARLKGEAREAGAADVRDNTDEAVADQDMSEALQEVTLESRTLECGGRAETGRGRDIWEVRDLRKGDCACAPRGDSLDPLLP